MDQTENEKGLGAALAAGDTLMECLRTDIEKRRSMSDGDDELTKMRTFRWRRPPRSESRNFSVEDVFLARCTKPDFLARAEIFEPREAQMAAGAEEWNALNIPILQSLFQVKKKPDI